MDFSLLVLGATLHWGDPRSTEEVDHYEDFNPGLGIGYHHDNVLITAGAYRNSIGHTSAFASLGLEATSAWHFGVTGSIMAVTGYIPAQPEQPMLVPIIGGFYEYDKTRLHAVFVYDGLSFFLEQRF